MKHPLHFCPICKSDMEIVERRGAALDLKCGHVILPPKLTSKKLLAKAS